MPDRLYFLVGDLVSNIAVGAMAGLACALIFDPGWNMLVAMLVAMPIGMLIALVSGALVFMRYFGAMEVMVPTMLGGMIAAMVVGMGAAMTPYGLLEGARQGAWIGLIVLVFCWYADYLIRGSAAPASRRPDGDGGP